MKGKDIHCPKCGAVAADVDPEYDLDDRLSIFAANATQAISATCTNGHRFIIGVRDEKKGLETMLYD